MDPIEIQYRLRKKGLRQQDFVRKGRSAQLISQVIYRITKSRPAEEEIAEALGLKVDTVFPDNIPLKTAA